MNVGKNRLRILSSRREILSLKQDNRKTEGENVDRAELNVIYF